MKIPTSLCCFYLLIHCTYGQAPASDLFASQEPLEIKLDFSFRAFVKETNDSTYIDNTLYYRSGDNAWDSIDVKLRRRGGWRLQNCFFPPVKVRIKKKDRKGTPFAKHKNLKLVLPCHKSKDADALISREYLCYKIYEEISPYSFQTRLTPLTVVDHKSKKDEEYQVLAFLIEDDKRVADRNDGKIQKESVIHPARLHDTTAVRHAFFQYMIANMDWSTTYQHNSKLMRTDDPVRYIPLCYDFDQAGFVNAHYTVLNPEFEEATVNPLNEREHRRQRIYRGFCRNNDDLMFHVRDEYLAMESKVYSLIEGRADTMKPSEYKSLVRFMDDFYDVLKDDKQFTWNILKNCRTK